MCQKMINVCVSSMRPLVFAGSFLLLILGVFLVSNCYYSNDLYSILEASEHWLSKMFWPQLIVACYLLMLAIAGCLTAYYEHKEAIRVFAVMTTINLILAIVAVIFIPHASSVGADLKPALTEAQQKYNMSDMSPVPSMNPIQSTILSAFKTVNPTAGGLSSANDSSKTNTTDISGNLSRPARNLENQQQQQQSGVGADVAPINEKKATVKSMDAKVATKIWDYLQSSKSCCGIENGQKEWKEVGERKIPKSCCSKPIDSDNKRFCETVDPEHQRGCLDLAGLPVEYLWLATVAIAIVNIFLAVVTGLSSYRLYHYDEANTNPY